MRLRGGARASAAPLAHTHPCQGLERRLGGLLAGRGRLASAAGEMPVGGPLAGHWVSERAEEADGLEAATGTMVCCQDVSMLC